MAPPTLLATPLSPRLGPSNMAFPHAKAAPTRPDRRGQSLLNSALTARQRPHNHRAGSDNTEVFGGGQNHQQQSPAGRNPRATKANRAGTPSNLQYRSIGACANTTPNTTRRYWYVTGAVPHLQSLPGPDTAPVRRSGRQQLPHTPPPQNISDTDAGFAAAHGTDTLRRLRAMWAWRRTYRRHSDSGLGRRATANEKGKKSSPSSCKSGPSASPHPGNIAL